MVYIKDMHEGDRLSQVFSCREKKTGVSKNGKNYYSLHLQDKTGSVDAKIWDLSNAIEHFESGDYIKADAEVTVYNGLPQLKITRVRRANEGEYDETDYLPSTPLPVDGMFQELLGLIGKIEHPKLRQLVDSFFVQDVRFVEAFKKHSAAKSIHHSFCGGLLHHTLRVTQMCYFFAKQYPMLNRDLLLTAAVFHDIGKLRELSDFPENDYTDEGQLIGHIVIGYQMVKERMDKLGGFPKKLENELLHCILAHQGKLEYGSPKVPSLLEAVALNYADDADAKMEILLEEFGNTESKGFLGVNRFVGANVRKTEAPEA